MQIDVEAMTAVGVVVGVLSASVGVLYKRALTRETEHDVKLAELGELHKGEIVAMEKLHHEAITAKEAELSTERRERRLFVEKQVEELVARGVGRPPVRPGGDKR